MRKMIYKDVDPMNYDEFKTELSNSNNIYLVAELENEIVGICFSNIKEISNVIPKKVVIVELPKEEEAKVIYVDNSINDDSNNSSNNPSKTPADDNKQDDSKQDDNKTDTKPVFVGNTYEFSDGLAWLMDSNYVYLLNDDGKVVNKFSGKNTDGYFDFQKNYCCFFFLC